MTDNTALAEQMGVHPDDLDEHGVLKPYVPPQFAPYANEGYPDTELPTRCDPAPGDEPLPTPRTGWCPNGNVNGGICSPFNNVRPNWMGYYPGATGSLRIDEMILPGTHNSAMDKQAPYSNSYDTCQDVSPHSQLHTGIRVLDLRVQFSWGYPLGDRRRFSIFHGLDSKRTIEGDCLQAATNLYTAHSQEVVILDFHQFKNFTDAAHRELATIIKNWLGSRLIEPKWNVLVLRQLWALQKNVVIAYNSSQRDPLFWPGVNQRWIGKDTPSSSELKSFIDRVGNEVKPDYELRSIQAHKYTKVYQPDDMSPDVMNWFAAGAADSPIMKFHIINTDWSLRHRHIDNCIHANSFRSRNYSALSLTPQDLSNGYIPHGHRAIALEAYDGNWLATMRLPVNGTPNGTLLIINKAQWNITLQVFNSNIPTDNLTLVQGDVVLFIYNIPQSRWVVQPETVYSPATSGDTVPTPSAEEKFIRYQTGDGNWTEHVNLPTSAPAYSYVEISSSAGYYSYIHRRSGERVYRCQRDDKYLFMFNQGSWQVAKAAIHTYGAAQAGAQMADTGTEQTQVHFRNGDFVREITLPINAWNNDKVTLTSTATYTATVKGTNLATGVDLQLKTGDTLHFRYVASTNKWSRIPLAQEEPDLTPPSPPAP
ncbi:MULTISPECIES: hypothetical protein [Pseudomonas]|uniref:hypothetical protein n=1 Tax=Pseudomonas TaxID=286 RepID=UPI001BEABC3B|nr:MULTISPECIES: hypothetical protein [Pseudomonas]MBT2338324.1 hypothetical protein [Pseudomonas fluorescens]MCD4528426.1 hypothetical protein [Pseudomonas sp. C3-2018]